MFFAGSRGHEFFIFVGIRTKTDVSSFLHGGESEYAGHFFERIQFGISFVAYEERCADVDEEEDGLFFFLFEKFDVGAVSFGGCVPVDVPNIVPIMVLSEVAELQS